MPRLNLTYRQKQFIRKNRTKLKIQEIASSVGISRSALRRYMQNTGIALTKKERYRLVSERNKQRTSSDKKTDAYLRKNYLVKAPQKIADEIGRSETFVKTRLRQLNLKIPKSIILQRIADSRIKPGNVPLNKGKKMPKAVYEKCKATMFKKGGQPANTKYDGCIVTRKAKRGERPYQWIRIAKKQWKMLHVHVWENKYGPVPKGHVVIFRNKNTLDCRLRNLKLVTRAEHMQNNTIHRYPPELKQLIRINSKLKRRINHVNEKQNK